MIPVLAIGLSAEDRKTLAEMIAAPVQALDAADGAPDPNHRPSQRPSQRRAVVFKGLDADRLAAVLAQGFDLHVEWTALEPTAEILKDSHPPLVVSMTTRSAYQALSGSAVADIIAARDVLAESGVDAVASAVQEALSNAIIHGNLGMRLDPSGDRDFLAFHEAIARRIASRDGLARRVVVGASWSATELAVSVADDGAGFTPPAAVPERAGAVAGRGLGIMKSCAARVAYERGGRVTVLTFDRAS